MTSKILVLDGTSPAQTVVKGSNTTISFTAPDQIDLGTGTWDITPAVGDGIEIEGAGPNNGSYTVESATSTNITTVETTLSTAGAGASINIRNWVRDQSYALPENFPAAQIKGMFIVHPWTLSYINDNGGSQWSLGFTDFTDQYYAAISASNGKTGSGAISKRAFGNDGVGAITRDNTGDIFPESSVSMLSPTANNIRLRWTVAHQSSIQFFAFVIVGDNAVCKAGDFNCGGASPGSRVITSLSEAADFVMVLNSDDTQNGFDETERDESHLSFGVAVRDRSDNTTAGRMSFTMVSDHSVSPSVGRTRFNDDGTTDVVRYTPTSGASGGAVDINTWTSTGFTAERKRTSHNGLECAFLAVSLPDAHVSIIGGDYPT